jgi:hypothetical protein
MAASPLTGRELCSGAAVNLDVLAADNPGGVGVRWMYFREWKYDPTAVQWVIVRNSGWLYTENSTPWILAPGSGVKYRRMVCRWSKQRLKSSGNCQHQLISPVIRSRVRRSRNTGGFRTGSTSDRHFKCHQWRRRLYVWRPDSTGAPIIGRIKFSIDREHLVYGGSGRILDQGPWLRYKFPVCTEYQHKRLR